MLENINHPRLQPDLPSYPDLPQFVRVTAPTIGNNIYPAVTQQYNGSLSFRDRELCYVLEPNGVSLFPQLYDCRLIGSYLNLPLYATSCCATGAFSSSSSGSATGTTPQLAAHWPLNEGVGTTAFDLINGYDMTSPSMQWSVDTPGTQAGSGGSIYCDASYALSYVNTIAAIPKGSLSRTFSIWFKLHGGSATFTFEYSYSNILIRFQRDSGLLGVCFDSYETVNASKVGFQDSWHLYTFTTNGTRWSYYEDGALDTSGTFSPILATDGNNVGIDFQVGSGNTVNVKDARLYAAELTATQVLAIFNGNPP